LLITQNHQIALFLHHAFALVRESAFAVLAHKRCLLGLGLAAAGPDYDCAYLASIGLPYLDLPEEHG